ncbi:MAG: UDP-N-acetylglucosamine 2-epimerase (non-hydrolyzing) [Candidatus Nitrosopolaris wilkensis]|nr:MAG: UDP-N-acetylglucosamine 2-epimerase (non-hydrolyzing) [Candidatus Nitrosopolaris wilkensis]
MKIVSVVGARPNFIKLAAVHGAISSISDHSIIHTGQHYDYRLSQIFFKEFNLPKPDFNLGVGSGAPGYQMGEMLKRFQKILDRDNKFDIVLVYGDTNSTFAGAFCATRSGIKVAHVEAGLRSFDRRMPEETNRILTDHLSDYLFAPTAAALKNLKREHVTGRVIHTGDVSVEIVRHAVKKLLPSSQILRSLQLDKHHNNTNPYILMTIHRAENTSSEEGMISLIRACEILAYNTRDLKIIFPIHPRTANFLKHMKLYRRFKKCKNVHLINPVGYIDFIALMKNAKKIVTDSGGVQKESYLLGIPCITVRKSTEWVETVEAGGNILTDTNTHKIVKAVKDWNPPSRAFSKRSVIFGNGRTSEKIKNSLMQ